MYRGNSTSNHTNAYMHPYSAATPSYNGGHQQTAYVNGSGQYQNGSTYPAPHFTSMQHSQHQQKHPPPQPMYYSYGDSMQNQQSSKRLQLSGQTAPPGGSIVSGLLSNSGMAPAGSTSSFTGATDPLNALQNLAARQGVSATPTGLSQTPSARQTYQMIQPGQQPSNHMFVSQNPPPVSVSQMNRNSNLNYEASRVSKPQENFQRISLPPTSAPRPILPAVQPPTHSMSGGPRRPNTTSTAPRIPEPMQQFAQDEEVALEKLRQLSVRYTEALRNYLAVFPEARHRFSALFTLMTKPTVETLRAQNLTLTNEWLLNVETTFRNQLGLRPASPPAAPPSPPKPDADVKGPYIVGNDLFFLLHTLGADAEGRRKLDQARLAIHNSLQLDGIIGLPSHLSHVRRADREDEMKEDSIWDEPDPSVLADRTPVVNSCDDVGDEVLSDEDQPCADEQDDEDRVDMEIGVGQHRSLLQAPVVQPEVREVEEDDEDESMEAPKTEFNVKEMTESMSTEVWCEIRTLPEPFRVRLNAHPPAMAAMENEDTCLDVGEWNSSIHLTVKYDEERLPCDLPGLSVRLPADYPEFRHLTWLVERSAYGLPENDKEEVADSDVEEDAAAFKRLVGKIFEERSAKVRRTYAEELSLYRVLVTWHNSIMDAFSKYSGLEDLKKTSFF